METLHQVEDIRDIGDGIFELTLERNQVAFRPGDCLALFAGDGRTSRPYSIASGVDEGRLRFVIRRIAGGAVSAYLGDRRPGDPVVASPPFGWFHPGPKGDGSPFVFIATGTGIAPFLSYLRSCPDHPPAACLYGVRRAADAVEVEWLRQRCDLRLAVSRERREGALFGRVTDMLDGMPCGPDHHFFLCGLDAMIDEISDWLEARSVPLTHIHRECFFNASYATP